VALCLILATSVCAEVFFKETFEDGDKWKSRWVDSDWKKDDGQHGTFKLTHGAFYGDAEEDKGIQTSEDAKFYSLSAKLPKPFNTEGKDLVVQFSVKHEQDIDCGGGYIKILPDLDQKKFTGDSEYAIMFGPDICGTSTRKVHVIFTYKGKNLLIKKEIPAETDRLTHVYTLIVHPDNTYEVRIDGSKKESGKLEDDWDFLAPKKIKDPNVSKPSDWVDEAMMDDPEDKKPADYDDTPKEIPDPDAKKPDDWDDEADGAWEAPKIPNPEYKGDWKPKRIKNPNYKGKWVHPEIDNPDYSADDKLAAFSLGYVGFDLWQVKSGTIFDNLIITDSVSEAEKLLAQTWSANKDAEKKMFDDQEKKKRDEEEAARKKSESEKKKDDDDDDDDDDEDDKKGKDEL